MPAEARKLDFPGRTTSFPQTAPILCKPSLATGETMPAASRFRGGLLQQPRRPFCSPFVPVAFDLYRPLKPRLRWAMQCLVSFADHAGRCFP